MKYNKLKIIESGETCNSSYGEDGALYKLCIAPESLASLVELGNAKRVHCRKTHNGSDLLDGYVGYFDNFIADGETVYADLTISEAMISAYPAEAKFISELIEKEPDMLGVSVVDMDVKEFDNTTYIATVVKFTELISCDLVGLPAATSSLFSINKSCKEMSKFFSNFKSLFSKTELAVEKVQTKDGNELLIESATGELAVGDYVKDSDGNPIPDGEEIIKADEGYLVLVIKDGKIADVKAFEEEDPKDTGDGSKTPAEFSKRLESLEATVSALNATLTKLSKGTPAPQPSRVTPTKTVHADTKLSRDAVAAAAAKYYKK